ncbi:MAG: Heat shock protein GrpE [Myxococcaceae bacterium]|jgi:molecular chaperone GrpE|nr:Heat shock protein GrpE [Myxococcaceae bacterium]MEA2751632.1 molecular chaperone GrpE [Myxococcales bacterium]
MSPEPNDKNGVEAEPETAGPASGAAPSSQDAPQPGQATTDPVADAKAEAQRFKEQWMRSAADFDNFRKRSRKELEDTRKAGREELLKDLLPVFDNLERAMTSAERATEVKPVSDGLKMVLRQFTDTLGRSGITKVPTIGQQFDPGLHEAIQQVETDEHPPGTVVAEVQPGYLQGDRLVRAAMVVVAKPKSDGAGAGGDEDGKKETEA